MYSFLYREYFAEPKLIGDSIIKSQVSDIR